ncbi:hypothetical protein [Synoicihabitans lomoniglobus]|uniref:DUF4177 domain-containing protein n=1 Tax=Synoicihabitans lomoniglobus TaxID=2909285 RepID=A0AAF0A0Z8_9BACT|nr:hypothetical protein [Opitutaceae bacterium LMO-M01]WED64627.1 hypothetical protein PXH66_19975 [Opitutaceae bacterium LMO-M01]
MAIWEYKVISSGKGGFATPQLLENFINEIGKDEWEIIDYRPAADNPLAFTGLARRSTQRDWTLEAAAAAQAKAEEERRRAEERAEKAIREAEAERNAAKAARDGETGPPTDPADGDDPKRDDSLRTLRDTERDDDPEALAEEAEAADDLADWDEMDLEDDLPTLFDAIKPHLRRNQQGPGEAAAIDYLARRWDQEPSDVLGALQECGLTVPENDDDAPEYFDFEGDLFWLNRNARGQLFINVREKPRPRFKPTTLRKLDADDPATEDLRAEHETEQKKKQAAREEREAREAERAARRAAAEAEAAKPPEPLPEDLTLLDLLKPKMRRNRRGPGMSGTVAFLSKALKHDPDTLVEGLAKIGLKLAEGEDEKPEFLEVGDELFWLKADNRGGVWINCRDKDKVRSTEKKTDDRDSEDDDTAATDATAPESDEAAADATQPEAKAEDKAEKITFEPGPNALPALRLLLKKKTRGSGASAEVGALARALEKPAVEILEVLVKAGLSVPDDADEKPAFVELGDEIMWINRNAKDESLWLNAKAKPKRGARSRTGAKKKSVAKKADTSDEAPAEEPS